jgi:hypothetical protein
MVSCVFECLALAAGSIRNTEFDSPGVHSTTERHAMSAIPTPPAPITEWELVDTTGKRRARGTFEHVEAAFLELANSEFQNKTMTTGFTLRRVPSKGRKRSPKRSAPKAVKLGQLV